MVIDLTRAYELCATGLSGATPLPVNGCSGCWEEAILADRRPVPARVGSDSSPNVVSRTSVHKP